MSKPVPRRSQRNVKRVKAKEEPVIEQVPIYDTLSDLPLDVLFEIFGYLRPMDLLTLAQTAKVLRKFLTNRISKAVWTKAISEMEGLPPCPPDLTEPQYVNLMFSNHCHVGTIHHTIVKLPLIRIPSRNLRDAWTMMFKYWTEMRADIDTALISITPETITQLSERDRMSYTTHYLHPRQPRIGRFDSEVAMRLHSKYRTLKGPAKETWLDQKKAQWEVLKKHAEACETFFKLQWEKDRQEEAKIKAKRVEQIKQKLIDLGWSRELVNVKKYPELPHHGLVDRPQELDEEDWEQMKSTMVEAMKDRRRHRLAEQNKKVIASRVNAWVKPAFTDLVFSQSPNALLPSLFEVCMIPEIRAVLCTTPFQRDHALTAEMFEGALSKIPAFVEKWRRLLDAEVLDLVRQSTTYEGQEVPENVLSLATTIFRCHRCNETIAYPHILAHLCNFRPLGSRDAPAQATERGTGPPPPPSPAKPPPTPQDEEKTSTKPPQRLSNYPIQLNNPLETHILRAFENCTEIWNGLGEVTFDDNCHSHMCLLLDGLEWSRETTISEMEEKQPYVQCFCQCYRRRGRQFQRAIRWMKAMQDCGEHVIEENRPKHYAKLEGDNLRLIRKHEGYQESARHRGRDLLCPFCKGSSDQGLEYHLKTVHKVANPTDPVNGLKAFCNSRRLYGRTHLNSEHIVRLDFDFSSYRMHTIARERFRDLDSKRHDRLTYYTSKL